MHFTIPPARIFLTVSHVARGTAQHEKRGSLQKEAGAAAGARSNYLWC